MNLKTVISILVSSHPDKIYTIEYKDKSDILKSIESIYNSLYSTSDSPIVKPEVVYNYLMKNLSNYDTEYWTKEEILDGKVKFNETIKNYNDPSIFYMLESLDNIEDCNWITLTKDDIFNLFDLETFRSNQLNKLV